MSTNNEITLHISDVDKLVEAINRLADIMSGAAKQPNPHPQSPVQQPAVTAAQRVPVATVPVQPNRRPVPSAPTQPPVPPAPIQAPVAPPPQYTMDQLQLAAGTLMDMGPQVMQQLQGLLQQYGITRVTDLRPEQMGAYAADLRRLGARI